MKEGVSARQLAVAAFTGLLGPAAAVAGMDWRGALLAVPVVLTAARCWEVLGRDAGGWAALRRSGMGRVLAALYLVWSVLVAGTVLVDAGGRMAAPGGSDTGWVILLIWVPVLLLTRKSAAAYGRAAEIFYLGMLAALAFVLVMGSRQIRLERLLGETEGLWGSFVSAAGVGCGAGAVLLLWRGEENEGGPRWIPWALALSVASLAMRVVTVGVLGPHLAQGQERPFFLMTVGLGQTARVEGLAAAVWLLSDVTLAGLMLQCGKGMWRELGLDERCGGWVAALTTLGAALALDRMSGAEVWMKVVLPRTTLVFGGGVPVLSCLLRRKNSAALERKS